MGLRAQKAMPVGKCSKSKRVLKVKSLTRGRIQGHHQSRGANSEKSSRVERKEGGAKVGETLHGKKEAKMGTTRGELGEKRSRRGKG